MEERVMQKVMGKLGVLPLLLVFAVISANCSRDNSSEQSSPTIVGPSATEARGSGGGKPKPGGGTGGSGSLTLVMVNDVNRDGQPNWGDTVTFNISTSATTEPNVSLTCSQNGKVVYGATGGFYDGYPWPWTKNMTLSSSSWTGGAASCVAKLYYFSGTSQIDLGSTSFTAYE
jgi:hypothetical protein